MTYQDLIESKVLETPKKGFSINQEDISPILLPHQRDIVMWAAAGGRRAIFAQFGLGKTIMQLELMRLCLKQCLHPGKGLIVCPLGVKGEFKKDAAKLGMEIRYVRNMLEVHQAMLSGCAYMITNYERVRDGDIDPAEFDYTSLDEASVLRSYGSKTYQEFLPKFDQVPYRFVATATPSPNRFKELIHYAGFLGILDTGQALTRFFQRNSEKAGDLTLYPHKEDEFWLWVASWSVFLQKPSNLGYSDNGYDLPELKVVYHRVGVASAEPVKDRQTGQFKMFRDPALSLSDAAKEKNISLGARLEKAIQIIGEGGSEAYWLLWHHYENERTAIEKALPEAITVYGSQKEEEKELLLIGFGEGRYRILATKPEIAGQGCNFQEYCHRNVFLGIDYGFNDFIQAIHRTHRYQQANTVEVHIIYTDAEDEVLKTLERKWAQHREMTARLTEIIQKYGLSGIGAVAELRRSMGVERKEVTGRGWQLALNDCVLEARLQPDNSKHHILTSIPFSDQYEYSPNYNDFGHNAGDTGFFRQMDYLTPELLRILKPGRVAAIHVKDRILFGAKTGLGFPTVNPFSDKVVAHFQRHGFHFTGRITIMTDVVRENNQTYRLGYSECRKDGTKMGCGMNEYLLLFRKQPTDLSNSYADDPVVKSKEEYPLAQWQLDASGLWQSSGNRHVLPEELAGMDMQQLIRWWRDYSTSKVYDYRQHIDIGLALEAKKRLPSTFMLLQPHSEADDVWTDVVRMRTLNSRQSQGRDQNHVCPLQLDIVERSIGRFTMKGEVVYDPFAGIGTVPYVAIQMGRQGEGSELNPEYWQCGVGYCKEAEAKFNMPTLFDMIRAEAGPVKVD